MCVLFSYAYWEYMLSFIAGCILGMELQHRCLIQAVRADMMYFLLTD